MLDTFPESLPRSIRAETFTEPVRRSSRKPPRTNRVPAGVFPPEAEGGVPFNPALCNAYEPNHIIVGEGPFWASPDCTTGLSDCQMNALAAEIVAAVDAIDPPYDSSIVTNLARALQQIAVSGGGFIDAPADNVYVRTQGAWVPLAVDGGEYP